MQTVSVALRKESVDRNGKNQPRCSASCKSLSARRAWIEIIVILPYRAINAVALRKESVDRNDELNKAPDQSSGVALRKESVDRNMLYLTHKSR